MKGRIVNASILASLSAVVVVMWVVLVSVPKSSAIPAFSRKYQTSCTTCHNNYPELNDFGEAFKKNGFKFPKDDEVFVKEPPVLLGSKAQKEAFPGAVYPGEIPGYLPIAFRYEGNFNWNAKQPRPVQAAAFVPRTDLFVPNTFTIISTGSFGPNLSFWIDDDISAGGTGAGGGLGDAWLKYSDLGHGIGLPKNALNVRFGQFEPDLPFSQARTYYLSGYDVFGEAIKAQNSCSGGAAVCQTAINPFVLGTPQRGIEFGGTPNNGNFNWSVAYLDGTGSAYGSSSLGPSTLVTRNTKDVYLRASYKFNLERDPESRNAIQAAGPTGPRDHTSIRVGAFYYHGTNEQNFGSATFAFTGTIQEPFYRAGGDIRFKYRKLELYGVGVTGHDDNHLVDTSNPLAPTITKTNAVTFTGGFIGSNYWIHPWLIATMRYDFVNSPSDLVNGISRYRTRNAFRPGYQILVRANIKVVGEYQRHWEPGSYGTDVNGNPLFYRPNTFVSGIDYVF
ncbi:MAG: hypothetical protein ACHQLQ_06605 [Candidatus Acidiferrales bacterium]